MAAARAVFAQNRVSRASGAPPASPVSEPLNARFQRLEPLIDRALELEDDERDRFLAMCGEIHPDLIDDLRRALAPDDAVLPALGGLAAEVTREKPTDRRGLRAGAWRLLDKIGRGGMGTVYLAERADGAFEKRARQLYG